MKKFLSFFFIFIFIFSYGKNLRFAIISDIHLYDTILGIKGSKFNDYIENDRKLLKESTILFDNFLKDIQNETIDFILVSGDITKDGELVNHKLFIEKISEILKMGIKIFVIPGNHDINNFDAYRYCEDSMVRVETIEKKDFENLYKDFGYSNYFSKDDYSLSYIQQITHDLFLIGLDGCQYFLNDENNRSTVWGKLNPKTLIWLEKNLEILKDKKFIVMIHHNLLEHFKGQKKGYPQYVLKNNLQVLKILSKYNVNLIFTGHFHANDISRKKINNKFIFDIETGSPVTFPSPYRIVEFENDTFVKIKTYSLLKDSATYFHSMDYTQTGIYNIAFKIIRNFKISQKESDILAKKISYSMVSHYCGDEKMPENFFKTKDFSIKAKFIMYLKKDMFKNLLVDSTPDNDVLINLFSGEISKLK